jgi:hypothetical protein
VSVGDSLARLLSFCSAFLIGIIAKKNQKGAIVTGGESRPLSLTKSRATYDTKKSLDMF